MGFDYSQLRVNDMVDVTTELVRDANGHLAITNPQPGQITNVMGDAVNILMLSDTFGHRHLMFCVHVDDDKCKTLGPLENRFHLQTNDETGVVDCGIFRLSRNQKMLLAIPGQLEAQEELLNRLLANQASMETRLDALEGKAPSSGGGKKRGPRPKAEPAMAE